MPTPPASSGCSLASATVAGAPGHPGLCGSYPASAKRSIHGVHESAWSHRPWTKTTARRDALNSVMVCLPGVGDLTLTRGGGRPLLSDDWSRSGDSGVHQVAQLAARRHAEEREHPVEVEPDRPRGQEEPLRDF